VVVDRQERLAHAAYLFYIQDQSQTQIAKEMGVTASNVSRMLRAAREQSIIRFEITYPLKRRPDLEQDVLDRFSGTSLREVIVASVSGTDGSETQGILAVGQALCQWLDVHLRDGQRLGTSYGGTIESMVRSAHFDNRHEVEVVQIAGELSMDPRFSGHDLVRNFAEKLGGRYRYFNAPAMTSDEAAALALGKAPQVAEALEIGRSSDVAIVSVGAFGQAGSDLYLRLAHATEAEIAEARTAGAVGQLSGRFFDGQGRQLETALDRRLISLDLDDLRSIDNVIGLGASKFKAEAVRAAIAGGLLNTLVVDEPLAIELLAAEPTTETQASA
jgi:deoxyribonucleoside regulator